MEQSKEFNKIENYMRSAVTGKKMEPEIADWISDKLDVLRDKFSDLVVKVEEAQVREKAGIERQKVYAESQTQVEEARHENILDEIRELKAAGITTFNRSSYPFLPRFNHKKKPGKHLRNRTRKPRTS